MSNAIRASRITEISSEDLLRAMAWWDRHQPYVQRLVDGRDDLHTAYPPSGSDCSCPELWRAPHWRWLKEKSL